MKQIFPMIAVVIMIAASKNSGAQSKSDLAINTLAYTVNMPLKLPDKKTFEINVMQVNIKAVRKFIRCHKNISDERWFKIEGGYIANFLSGNIDTRIVYNNNGNWLYNLFFYTEDKLQPEIRNMVKSNYYDYEISFVFEYKFYDRIVYVIRIRDQSKNLKVLRICDGEMEEITDYMKD